MSVAELSYLFVQANERVKLLEKELEAANQKFIELKKELEELKKKV